MNKHKGYYIDVKRHIQESLEVAMANVEESRIELMNYSHHKIDALNTMLEGLAVGLRDTYEELSTESNSNMFTVIIPVTPGTYEVEGYGKVTFTERSNLSLGQVKELYKNRMTYEQLENLFGQLRTKFNNK